MHLILRPYLPEDAASMLRAAQESVKEIQPFMPWCKEDYASADAEAWIATTRRGREAGSMYDFAITCAGEVVGGCGINCIRATDGTANVGYWVRTRSAGRGVATRAVTGLLKWGVDTLALHRFEIVAAVSNLASQRVAEKVGATRECRARLRTIVAGVPEDAYVYAYLKGDPLALVEGIELCIPDLGAEPSLLPNIAAPRGGGAAAARGG